MARSDGDFVEYVPKEHPDAVAPEDFIVRIFGSEVRALRSAVANGNRVKFLPYGQSLAEALSGLVDPNGKPPAGKPRSSKPKLGPDPEIANGPGNPESV